MDSGTLTVTGIIATIFSAIFAIAAFWNAQIRRRHLAHLNQAKEEEEPRVKFKPMPTESQAMFRSDARATRHGKAATVHDQPVQVFRQVGPSGNTAIKSSNNADNLYSWE